ncbi:MAG: hypothetical protein KDB35_01810 [Acidimicrobiales bacterium]|nr:hypothetical protein [Acidimicrobiales bacterium]
MAVLRVAVEDWLDSDDATSLSGLIGEALDLLGDGFAARSDARGSDGAAAAALILRSGD